MKQKGKNKNSDPVIVQFLHPGHEKRNISILPHPYPVNGVKYDYIKYWSNSLEGHGRKFIVNPGEYYDGQKSVPDKQMHLWCEAEWDSLCRKIGKKFTNVFPCFEHVVRNVPAMCCSTAGNGINTDPYIFGNAFKYCCCQQYRKTGPTCLHNLPVGSIILFGSCMTSTGGAGFCLDTVFVVDRKLGEYSNGVDMCSQIAGMGKGIKNKVSVAYQKRVLEKIGYKQTGTGYGNGFKKASSSTVLTTGKCLSVAPTAKNGKGLYSLYIGKVFDPNAPYQPFSFVPVLPGSTSYVRPLLTPFAVNGKMVISPGLKRGFKVTKVPQGQMSLVWSSLLKALPPDYKYAWHIDE